MVPAPPKVSVIIPVHNSSTTLRRALRSVAEQDVDGLEVIIFDDASVDHVAEVMAEFDALNLVYLRSEDNVGAAEARNRAIEASSGQYLAFLDADDEWLPGKLSQQIALLNENVTASCVYCEAEEFEAGGRKTGVTNQGKARPSGVEAWKVLLKESCLTTSCVMARREVVLDIGGFRSHLLSGQDQDLWIRLALAGDVIYQPEALVHYYILNNSLSQRRHTTAVGDLLSVIEGYVEELGPRLSKAEANEILSHRIGNAARAHYRAGHLSKGLGLMKRAVSLGAPAWRGVKFLVKNSPPALQLKTMRDKPPIELDVQFDNVASTRPALVVVIDTEEEFDWSKPFSRDSVSVDSIQYQMDAQEIFARFGIKPVYVVDYPVANSEPAVEFLKHLKDSGECLIGAHLHPWVTPPFVEEVNEVNSFPGNLPFEVEYKKLAALTEKISSSFGSRPIMYKAGRYGLGNVTPRILNSLGYEIDLSIVPFTDFSSKHGPDFSKLPSRPFWIGDDYEIYEVPGTCGYVGVLSGAGQAVYPRVSTRLGKQLHIPGILARSGLLERIPLTPEGMKSEAEMIRLVRHMHARGCRVFSLSYHSSTLMPGCNQYVRTELERAAFLNTLARFLDFFFNELGGAATTPVALRQTARKATSEPLT